jgi:5-methylcytosine-specific restriction protein A
MHIYRESGLPYAPLRPCNHPGCSALTSARFCNLHANLHATIDAARERQRGTLRRATTPAYYSAEWRRIRAAHLARYPYCQHCNRPAYVVDHIFPLRFGGTHSPQNLQSLCHSCHNAKTRREQAKVDQLVDARATREGRGQS